MPAMLDWRRAADARTVVRRAAEALRAGAVVGFPTETGYHLAAAGLSAEAVARLRRTADSAPAVAVRGPAEAHDWAPGLSPLGRRLIRRFWPGPLVLECRKRVAEGLAGRLSEPIQREVYPEGRLLLRCPAHEAVRATLRRLAGPLLLTPAPGPAEDADHVVRAAGNQVALVVDDGPALDRRPPTVVRVEGSAWKVVQPGAVTDGALRRQAACLVIFVCTGNTCRSPLAEGLLKTRLADRLGCTVAELPERGFYILSAGLAAASGGPAAEEAVEVARSYGADLTGHSSRPLSPELAAQADYLVAMTRSHLAALVHGCRGLAARPRLLSPAGEDLPDPIGCARPVYEECARCIWACLEPLVEELLPSASNAVSNG
ncbi:MAG TPA: Sua5/YciO/YrdC/YwlC family protein [Gemmataceae bacterium]|nr:Sua5/YciO/YrdC/YwlC family protein [Gemmataceae bacterium]